MTADTNQLATRETASIMPLLAGVDLSAVDTDKLGQMMDLQERWEKRQAEKALNEALAKFNELVPPIQKTREGGVKNLYANLDDIMEVIRPILSQCGLSVTFDMEPCDKLITAICRVRHVSGAEISGRGVPVPMEAATRGMNNAQAAGSAVKYAQRYALGAVLNLSFTDRFDDDGQSARTDLITAAQGDLIQDMFDKFPNPEAERRGWMKWQEIKSIYDLPAANFNAGVQAIQDKLDKL